jgi:hypothetical protein
MIRDEFRFYNYRYLKFSLFIPDTKGQFALQVANSGHNLG